MTHHFMTSSLPIKIFKMYKFGDFSSDIDYNSRPDIFRDDISLIINRCGSRRPKGASGGHEVSASRAAQASEARLYIQWNLYITATQGTGQNWPLYTGDRYIQVIVLTLSRIKHSYYM